MLLTVVGIILYDQVSILIQNSTIVYAAEIEEVQEEKKEVQIEVEIDWTKQGRIEQEIRKTFPDMPNTAVAIAKGESMLKPTAYNPEKHYDGEGNYICSGSYGVMQIACVHMLDNPEALFDVETNLRTAEKVYKDSLNRTGDGWLPWGAYTSGGWRQHL